MQGNPSRITILAHTPNHLNCPACMRAKKRSMDQGALGTMEFEAAASAWLDVHQRYISPRTKSDYQEYIKALSAFFSGMKLSDIHIGNVREYQQSRKISHGRINAELSTLQQMLKEAELWEPIASFYRALPVSKKGSGRALNQTEEERLLKVAFSRKRWLVAAHCIRIMLRTGTGFGELANVTRDNLDLERREMTIYAGAKNEERERTIPLNQSAWESAKWLVDRWERIGGRFGHEYLLPHNGDKIHLQPDFSRHMWRPKTAFENIRKEWAQGDPWLLKFRIYDCRVTAVTKSLKSGKVSIHTAKKLYGHVSQAMQKRYYKPDMDTLRDAVDLLDDAPLQPTRKMPQGCASQSPDGDPLRQGTETGAAGDAGVLVHSGRTLSA